MGWWYGTFHEKRNLALNCFNHSAVILSTITHCTSEWRWLQLCLWRRPLGNPKDRNPNQNLDQSADLLCKYTNIFPAEKRGKMEAEMNSGKDCLSWHCHQNEVGAARSCPRTCCLGFLQGLQASSVDQLWPLTQEKSTGHQTKCWFKHLRSRPVHFAEVL